MTTAIATQRHRGLYTYREYLTLPDDGKRYEIIEGKLYMSPAPAITHQIILKRLLYIIENFLIQNPLGELLPAPTDVILSEINILQPDLLFVAKENYEILTHENVQGAPDLVVEILSPGTAKRDRTSKLETYSEFGVVEYWIVDEEKQTVEVWQRKDRRLVCEAILTVSQTLKTALLPGLEIPLAQVFPTQ
ncbi:MAG: Uma2 family endonuclease [bacterium]